ncbi:protein phosphatase PTC7 homolog [Lepeophtheirus salmonis]|uniref:protein phosphatase PTC7 homolog n=1 Tax=Lepeophtheirus salmonis TaxID=72036 RepID=UPI001AE2CE64|nr:protein phosphatase PTC7 homolog [Lepeophtheirus salmonis]XP_040568024.1 protein phosphatase PTC7 homolog [Lepeophtheirus salmonis]
MHAIGCLSRIVSRTLVTGVGRPNGESFKTRSKEETKLVTAVSGFPKLSNAYDIDHIINGQIGDDAYFVTRHLDDWDSRKREAKSFSEGNQDEFEPQSYSFECNSADVIGVADGVGGWRQYGIDPGQFSSCLMKSCERLVMDGKICSDQPAKLLSQGYQKMQEFSGVKQQIIGSSTACVIILSHRDRMLYAANIGDSGFIIVRDGEVIHKSREQQHHFNTPFQLSLPPSELASEVLSDRPESADKYAFSVQNGDVIMLATDGIFDNVPEALLAQEMATIWGCSDHRRIQQTANSIALIARKLSQDQYFLSPFSRNARANGLDIVGGKQDDLTVLLATVILPT